jgi:hypothetical protein
MGRSAHFGAQRLANQLFERCGVAEGGPELELGVARRAELQQRVLTAVMDIEACNRLRMAAIEAFGEAQDRCKSTHDIAALARHVAQSIVVLFRRSAAVISRDERDHLDRIRLESAQIAVLD